MAEVQETPESELAKAPVGTAADLTIQLVPFHASTSAATAPEALVVDPTPIHAVAVEQEMADNKLDAAPDGLGVEIVM